MEYKNEVEKPAPASQGSKESSMGCGEFKKQAMEIAYGQASSAGYKSDEGKISSQMKDYHWTE